MAIIQLKSLSVSGCPTAIGDTVFKSSSYQKSSSFPTVYCTVVYG